jgi:hypothetical protein
MSKRARDEIASCSHENGHNDDAPPALPPPCSQDNDDAASPASPSLEYHDYYIGKRLRIRFDQRTRIDAPLHVIAAFSARLHLSRGCPLALEQPPPPSRYMRVSLWPAQLQRAAIGFAAAASRRLATAPASFNAGAVKIRRWRTRILLRVTSGYVARIQVIPLLAVL